MSYTIVDDDGILQVRASIKDAVELQALIEKLQAHLKNQKFRALENQQEESK